MDRSGTNWTPFPRLAGIPHRVQVVGGVLIMMGAAYITVQMRQRSGGKLPTTMTKEWEEAAKKSMDAKEREAADPVVLNPISKSMRERK